CLCRVPSTASPAGDFRASYRNRADCYASGMSDRREAIARRRANARDSEPASNAEQRVIDAWLERSWAEHGLSRSTLDNYRRDLQALAVWLARDGGSLLAAGPDQLNRWLAARSRDGYAARSNARAQTSVRRFYDEHDPNSSVMCKRHVLYTR